MPDVEELDAEDLDQLEALLAQATPWPWDGIISSGIVRYLGPPDPVLSLEHGDFVASTGIQGKTHIDAELIGRLRNVAPALITIARKLSLVQRDLRSADRFIELARAQAEMNRPHVEKLNALLGDVPAGACIVEAACKRVEQLQEELEKCYRLTREWPG